VIRRNDSKDAPDVVRNPALGSTARDPLRALFLAIVVIVLLVFGLFALQTWQDVKHGEAAEMRYVKRLLTQSTRTTLAQQEQTLRILGQQLLFVMADRSPENGRAIIEDATAADPGMAGFGFALPNGQLVLVSGLPSDADLPNLRELDVSRESFDEALSTDGLRLGRAYYMSSLGQWVIPIRLRLTNEVGEPLGVMAAGYTITGGTTTWSNLALPPHVAISIVREDGFLQFKHPADDTLDSLYGTPYEPDLMQEIRATGLEHGQLISSRFDDGVHRLVLFDHLPEYGIYTLAFAPYRFLVQRWIEQMTAAGLLLVVVLAIGRAVFVFASRAQRRYEERLLHQARHDALTDLPNRTAIAERLDRAIEASTHTGKMVAAMFVDLDNFKHINDRYGHDLGDDVLRTVARRLCTQVAPGDTVARLGGDEFIIMLPAITSHVVAQRVAERILRGLDAPVAFGSRETRITASIGIALAPTDGTSTADILRRADLALYNVKDEGRNNYGFYTDALNREVERRLCIEEELREALARDELSVYYQPQASSRNASIWGVEALVRWTSPRLGQVPPDEFIPIAEDIGLINDIDEFVLKTACRELQAVALGVGDSLHLSVNISMRNLLSSGVVARISNALHDNDFPAQGVTLEMTETALVSDFQRASSTVAALRALGVGVAIDDFGTGYSSLAYLSRLNVTEIKIDRQFVRDLFSDPHDAMLTRSIVGMGKALGLQVVAEGVETEEQRAQLEHYGCDLLQGYLLSPPVPLEALVELLQRSRREPLLRQRQSLPGASS
jgi:diguanylate cyclase (GGDEF)-like protein